MFFLRLIRLLVYSNIFIAFCAVGLQWFVQPETSILAAAFLFSSVIVMYSMLKLLGLKNHARQSESSAIAWLQRNTALQFGITLIAFICAMLCWKQLGFPFYCKLVNSIGIAFVVYLLSNSAYDVFIPKIIPSLHENYRGCCCLGACAFTCKCRNFHPIYLFLWLFLFVLALMIPFEIRDMPYDAPFHVPTLPLLLGVQKAKQISYVLLMISFLLYLFGGSGMSKNVLLD
jgi:small-conductance mechanosensitive channel